MADELPPGARLAFWSDAVLSAEQLRRRRRWIVGVILALACVALCVAMVHPVVTEASGGVKTLLIGGITSDRFSTAALFFAAVFVFVALCFVRPWRLRVVLLVPFGLAACAAGVPLLLSETAAMGETQTALVVDGCATDYLVIEHSLLLSGSGIVYHQDGVVLIEAGRSSGDDGYHPFLDGAYAAERSGASIDIWYAVHEEDAAKPRAPERAPDLTLPARGDSCDR